MSTPSKKRRKARKWMHLEATKREAVERRFDLYRKDVQALHAREDRSYDEQGRGLVTSIIPHFPDPRKDGPVAKYVMPFVMTPRVWLLDRACLQSRSTEISFRAVEYGIEQVIGDSVSQLRWFNWEPETGSPALEARTRTFRDAIGRLSRARHELENAVYRFSPELHGTGIMSMIVCTSSAIEAVVDDLRRILGRFEVEGGMREEQRERATW